jgi:hypothetical protein
LLIIAERDFDMRLTPSTRPFYLIAIAAVTQLPTWRAVSTAAPINIAIDFDSTDSFTNPVSQFYTQPGFRSWHGSSIAEQGVTFTVAPYWNAATTHTPNFGSRIRTISAPNAPSNYPGIPDGGGALSTTYWPTFSFAN